MAERVLRLLSRPVHGVVHFTVGLLPAHIQERVKKHHRHMAHSTIGIVLVLLGSFMAAHPAEWMPHAMWDGVAYLIHGMGAVPIFHWFAQLGATILQESN